MFLKACLKQPPTLLHQFGIARVQAGVIKVSTFTSAAEREKTLAELAASVPEAPAPASSGNGNGNGKKSRTAKTAARLAEVLDGGARHIGFKDVGLPTSELKALADEIRSAGGRSYLEVVSLDAESERASARAAAHLLEPRAAHLPCTNGF